MRWDAEEGLTHDNKCRDVENGVGGQIVEVQPVVEHESADEWVERESQSADEVRDEYHPLMGLRGGIICPVAGIRWAISWAKYPASRSFVMSFSLMEEAIHLPCAPDPDMAGVLFCGGKDGSLGTGAREWMGREEEGVGEKVKSLSLYKGCEYQAPPHSP